MADSKYDRGMDVARRIRISKYLSRHLRHRPDELGITLQPGGWVDVEALLAACARHQFPLTRDELAEVVTENDKQRFSFDASGTRIRANQGHSIAVDLLLEAAVPPPMLYHGTGERAVPSILKEGVRKMGRHHVHLSEDAETARRVGARHGRPVILVIDAAAMARSGFTLYRSANGVWLVDHVPPQYISVT
jgi:putative RNA 2'-phosphotransferase